MFKEISKAGQSGQANLQDQDNSGDSIKISKLNLQDQDKTEDNIKQFGPAPDAVCQYTDPAGEICGPPNQSRA